MCVCVCVCVCVKHFGMANIKKVQTQVKTDPQAA